MSGQEQAPSRSRASVFRLVRRRHAPGRSHPFRFLRDLPCIWPYLRPYWPLGAASLMLMLAGAAISLITPWPLAVLVDTVLGDKPLPGLLGPLADVDRETLLVVAVAGGFVFTGLQYGIGVAQNYVETTLEQRMALDFRADLFEHVQRLSLAFHDQRDMGQLMYQITGQAGQLGQITVAIPALFQNVATLIGMFVVACFIDVDLALISLAVVPFVYLSAGYYMRRVEPRLYQVRGMEGETMSIVHEAMTMLRVVVGFGRESHELQRFRRQGESAVDARVKLTLRQTLFSLGVNMITATGTAAVLGVGAQHVLQRDLSVGELLVLMGYIAAIYQPLQQISSLLSAFQDQFIGLRWGLDLLEERPEIADPPDAIEVDRLEGHVVFDDVSFAHRGRRSTLSDISFDVPAGRRIGIVGPTGAGKSTLVSLIPRFYAYGAGRILVDGIDVRQLALESLRSQVSVVFQEPLLFSRTVYENIRYGRLDATREEIEAAARAASAHDFISRLPGGYHTEIGERGSRLSGGERQRVSIARAFLKDAPILILDEPTSSIDTETEGEILDALERLMVGRTTFMIAHRLSTLRAVDQILVLCDGVIIEHGTHEELLDRGGMYQRLYEIQARQSSDASGATVVDLAEARA